MGIEAQTPRHLGAVDITRYTDLSPRAYTDFLRAKNVANIAFLQEKFAHTPLNPSTTAIIVVGSDGKLERHAQSKSEFVVLQIGSDENVGCVSDIEGWFNRAHSGLSFRSLFDLRQSSAPEVKLVGTHHLLSMTGSDDTHIDQAHAYPDRVLNSQLIFGSTEVHAAARRQVLSEMGSMGEGASRMMKQMKYQLGNYRNTINSGIYRRLPVVDSDTGLQYYTEGDDPSLYRYGFKIGYIRAIQRKLDIATAKAVHDGMIDADEPIEEFPAHTGDRIRAFEKRGIIPFVDGLADAYYWFLQQYHHAQEMYKRTHTMVALPFNRKDFMFYKDIVLRFVKESK